MYVNANVCTILLTILNRKKYNVSERIVILQREIAPNRDQNEV